MRCASGFSVAPGRTSMSRAGQMTTGWRPHRSNRRHSFSIGDWNPPITGTPASRIARAKSYILRMTSPGHWPEQNRAVRSASRMDWLPMASIAQQPFQRGSSRRRPRTILQSSFPYDNSCSAVIWALAFRVEDFRDYKRFLPSLLTSSGLARATCVKSLQHLKTIASSLPSPCIPERDSTHNNGLFARKRQISSSSVFSNHSNISNAQCRLFSQSFSVSTDLSKSWSFLSTGGIE